MVVFAWWWGVQVQMQIWTEVVQAAMGALLEAFARVEKCSTEGRALMSMDLQVVQLGLDDIQRVRPGRGKVGSKRRRRRGRRPIR